MTLYFAIIATIFLLDWGSKAWIRSSFPMGYESSVLPFFSLVHTTNTGVAFGLFQGRNTLFLILGIVILIALVVYGVMMIRQSKMYTLPFALLVGGAMGNILDRIRFGRVTDFLDFYIGSYHWPAFNVADAAICIGAGWLIWLNFKTGQA